MIFLFDIEDHFILLLAQMKGHEGAAGVVVREKLPFQQNQRIARDILKENN